MVAVILHMVFDLLPMLCIFAGLGTLYATLPWEGPEDDEPLSPIDEQDVLDSFYELEAAGWNISGLSAQPFTGQLVAYLETPSEEPDMREYEACNPQNVTVMPCVIIDQPPAPDGLAETVQLRIVERELNDEELDAWIAHFSYNPTIPEVGSDESTFFGQLSRYESYFTDPETTVVLS